MNKVTYSFAAVAVLAAAAASQNLVAESITMSTTTLKPGYSTVFTGRIRNNGNRDIKKFSTAGVYLSPNSIISAGDTLLVAYGTPGLARGAAQTASVRARVPNTIAAGRCYLGLWADKNNVLPETRENDNVVVRGITCDGKADLAVTTISFAPSLVYRNHAYHVRWSVKNLGGVTSPSVKFGIYLSQNSVWEPTDQLVREAGIGGLTPGRELTHSTSFTVPGNAKLGRRYLIVVVDNKRQLAEISERNNEKWARTDVAHKGSMSGFGTTCRGSNGTPIHTAKILENGPRLKPGSVVEYRVSRARSNYVSLFVLGLSKSRFGPFQLPLQLPGTTCRLQVSMDAMATTGTNAAGYGAVRFPVPNVPGFIGAKYYTQFINPDPGANSWDLSATIGFENEIGS